MGIVGASNVGVSNKFGSNYYTFVFTDLDVLVIVSFQENCTWIKNWFVHG